MAKPLMCDPALFARDLTGKTFVVTGANSGIGRVTADQLVQQGARVVYAGRRAEEVERCAREAGERAEGRVLDLGSLASVRAFAEAFLADHDTLHGLINNAGVMNTPQGKTADGFETQLGVNHLGHVLLTELLGDALERGAPSRIVNVSSCFHDQAMGRPGEVVLDDLHFERRPYDGWAAYAQSKLANVLHAQALAERWGERWIVAVSVHPGWVRTNLSRHSMPLWVQNFVLRPVLRLSGMIEPWEGAQTTLHAALDSGVAEHAGAFFSQRGVYRDKACNKGGWPMRSPNPQAHDAELREGLWTRSRELVGL